MYPYYNTKSVPEYRAVNINESTPETLTNNIYTPAFLRTQIGKLMRVEFLIGTDLLVDRTGILIDVGASYILLRSIPDGSLLCEIFTQLNLSQYKCALRI